MNNLNSAINTIILADDRGSKLQPVSRVHIAETFTLVENILKLERWSKIDVQLVNVRTGEYLGDDQIGHYEKIYGQSDTK